ncbi:MAG: YgaP family membrane protein [Rubricella sp.]
MPFCKNVGQLERFLRINLGLVLLLAVFIGPQTPWGLIGIVPLVTGLFEFCPAYLLTKGNPFTGQGRSVPAE